MEITPHREMVVTEQQVERKLSTDDHAKPTGKPLGAREATTNPAGSPKVRPTRTDA